MPATKYQYPITDTANDKVYAPQLIYEIDNDDAIGVPVNDASGINVNVEPAMLDIYMDDLLIASQEAALVAAVAAHQGYGIDAVMQGTLALSHGEMSVMSDMAWEVLDGVVTTPSFFDPDMTKIISRIIGEHRGDGGQLRLVEDMDGVEEEKIVPFYNFPDTAGAWKRFKVDSNVPPRDGLRNIYRTDARQNGAASLELRYCTISMIVVKIV